MPGTLTISLDVELYWGVRDVIGIEQARPRMLGDRAVVPRILDLFVNQSVHATWATVGFLFFDGREDLCASLPSRRPKYSDAKLDPYADLASLGASEKADPLHFAPSLIRAIASAPHQEIGTHTFSHFYCLEDGQDERVFRDDLVAAKAAAARFNIDLKSLVFPRNQFNERYLSVCAEEGLSAYRGNPNSWIYSARPGSGETRARRAARLLDAYFPISHATIAKPPRSDGSGLVNVPASRFLRPYSRRLARLTKLQLHRVKREMTAAARGGDLYHLWWHPHNFGLDSNENLTVLREILDHYASLSSRYGMESKSMGEVAERAATRAA